MELMEDSGTKLRRLTGNLTQQKNKVVSVLLAIQAPLKHQV
jgi:hypothetical protein